MFLVLPVPPLLIQLETKKVMKVATSICKSFNLRVVEQAQLERFEN